MKFLFSIKKYKPKNFIFDKMLLKCSICSNLECTRFTHWFGFKSVRVIMLAGNKFLTSLLKNYNINNWKWFINLKSKLCIDTLLVYHVYHHF